MFYGRKSAFKKPATRRASGATRARRTYPVKKVGKGTFRKSATQRRLSRREIKYDDDYFNLKSWVKFNSPGAQDNLGTAGEFVNFVMGGMMRVLLTPNTVTASNGSISGVIAGADIVPNCLTNIDTGTTAKTRIGNMVAPRYITLKGVITAAKTNAPKDAETTFKSEEEEFGGQREYIERYMRTSIKIFVIRDKSMNEKGYVEYTDVFEPPIGTAVLQPMAAMNPFLWNRKVDVISRYDIINQWEYTLDQDDPQKSFTHVIPLKGVPIRYNGASNLQAVNGPIAGFGSNWLSPSGGAVAGTTAGFHFAGSSDAQSMTNGIYLLAVSHSAYDFANEGPGDTSSPGIVFSTRLTFEDN